MNRATLALAAVLALSFAGCSSSETTDEGTIDEDAGQLEDAAIADDTSTMDDTGSVATDATTSDAKTDTRPADATPVQDSAPPRDTGSAPAGCMVTRPGATGNEPGALIPVCCTPSSADKALVMRVFELVNQHRAANGKPPLVYDDKLESAIQGHCEHMRTHAFFSHDAPEAVVAKFTTRGSLCGTSTSGENIAKGYTSAEAVMTGWKNSPGHNANMLGGHRRIGIGKSGSVWGQMFGN